MTTLLRGGNVSLDPRLDRIPSFDERSWAYPARGLLAAETGTAKPPLRSYTWQVGPVLDQGREGACFPAGTMIQMADGSHKPIEDVRVLDEVVTAEGHRGVVLQTMVRRNIDAIAHVRLRGHNAFRATREHPVLARRRSGSRRRPTFTEGYVPAYDLRPGDYVALTRYQPDADAMTAALEVGSLVNVQEARGVIDGRVNIGGVVSDIAPLPSILFKDPDLGRLLGLYAAEGHTTTNKVVWTFGKHEDGLVNETMALIKDVLEAQPRVQQRPNNSTNVVLYGKTWRLLFERLIPGTARHGDKHLSPEVTASPARFLDALLEGWLDGDGHRRRTHRHGVTVSRRLALDMHAIAQRLGRRPTLSMSMPSLNEHAANRQDRWDLTFPEGNGANLPEQTDAAVWRRVIGVELESHIGWVFNLHVEGDESYVANGIGVHNCVGFGHGARVMALPDRHREVDNAWAREVYKAAQKIDEWPGENYEGTSVLAGAKVLKTRGFYEAYYWAFGIEDTLRAIGYLGPVVLGINWLESMDQVRPSGLVEVSGRVRGGHCILARGVRLRAVLVGEGPKPIEVVRLRNSWGPDHGVAGDIYVKVEGLERLLAMEGEALVPVEPRQRRKE